MCKNLQLTLFHAHLVVSLSAYISLKSDNYGLANHYMNTYPNTNKSHEAISYGFSVRVTVQFLVSNSASEMFKHSGCEKLLQNKKAGKGWEWLLYVYI